MEVLASRQSKYCTAIKAILKDLGHASNAELLARLHATYPDVSATTVHRATARLAERGEIGVAPSDKHGSMRYDMVVRPHDHFACDTCYRLRDADIVGIVAPLLESNLEDCHISGRLVVSGTCHECAVKQQSTSKGNA